MAIYAPVASGNINTASTWGLIYNDSTYSNITSSTTAVVGGTPFTSANITPTNFAVGAVTAFAVKLASASGTGTITFTLYNTTTASNAMVVTLNMTDINTTVGMPLGWLVLKPSSGSFIPNGTDIYQIKISIATVGATASFYSNGGTGLATFLRSSSMSVAPATSADIINIQGEYTGAGTSNSFNVTMNLTNSTPNQYTQIDISTKGILQYANTASTSYYFACSGLISIYNGGSLIIGTSISPIPSTGTANLLLATSSGGLIAHGGGTFKTYGLAKTNMTFLANDMPVSQSFLVLNSTPTNWKAGDNIAIAATGTTVAQSESKVITGTVTTSTVNITTTSAFAHSGTSPTQGEVINLTRNILINGTSTATQGYIYGEDYSIISIYNTELKWLGRNIATQHGITSDISNGSGSLTMNGCALHDFVVTGSYGLYLSNSSFNADNISITNCVSYNINTYHLFAGAMLGSINTNITGWTAIKNVAASTPLINLLQFSGNINGLNASSSTGVGIYLNGNTTAFSGSISNINSHTNTLQGVQLIGISGSSYPAYPIISNLVIWNNLSYGLYITGAYYFTFDNGNIFNNFAGGANIYISNAINYNINFSNLSIDSGSLGVSRGLHFASGASYTGFRIDNCVFGAVSTLNASDVYIQTTQYCDIIFRNCKFNSSVTMVNTAQIGSVVRSARHQQISGNHKTYDLYGSGIADSTIYHLNSPSTRLTPAIVIPSYGLGFKYESPIKYVPVPSGNTITIGVWVRMSVIGDGTAYGGNFPSLIVKKDTACGILVDTILATATSGASGQWQYLQGTTVAAIDNCAMSFAVTCDGVTGWINIDDWKVG